MGDLQACFPNALVSNEARFSPSPPTLSTMNPDPSTIKVEWWEEAEETTREIVRRMQPTVGDYQNRSKIIEYVKQLIRRNLGVEVFPYGSVPLRTFLPDGDIDLTVFSSPNTEDALVSDVHIVLKGEELEENTLFKVKDVCRIDAEVKLVKCLVQNVVVDISFNQLGGICTLCFLEQVDRLIGKDHLFKRSVVLIKAWCYYESRILGAHHGLISTYALETLILYIFHLFHSSLEGPLAVLYRFLDYFGKFDWENYCVSLKGPVRKSSLPVIMAEAPENGGEDLLLSEEFLRNCIDMFSIRPKGFETNTQISLKHLNIIDPLKANNNLGRSVNKGNFYRIVSAFKYGARKLGEILLLPRERMADELKRFFRNTFGRHRSCLSDEATPMAHGSVGSEDIFLQPQIRTFPEDNAFSTLGKVNCKEEALGTEVAMGYRKMSESAPPYQMDSESNWLTDSNVLASPVTQTAEEHDHQKIADFGFEYVANSTFHPENDHFAARMSTSSCFGTSGAFKPSKPLLELGGDYDSHIASLLYGQYCQNAHPSSLHAALFSPQFQNQTAWGTYPQVITYDATGQVYPVSHPFSTGAFVYSEVNNNNLQGTGTFYPNMNHSQVRPRPPTRRWRNRSMQDRGQFRRRGLATAPDKPNQANEGSHKLSGADFPVLRDEKNESLHPDASHPSIQECRDVNGRSCLPARLKSRSLGTETCQVPSLEASQPDSGTASPIFTSNPCILIPENNQQSDAGQAFQLKDEVDFPPLCC